TLLAIAILLPASFAGGDDESKKPIPAEAARNAILEMIKADYADDWVMAVIAERIRKSRPKAEEGHIQCGGNVRWHPTKLTFVISFFSQDGRLTKEHSGVFQRKDGGLWEAKVTRTINGG